VLAAPGAAAAIIAIVLRVQKLRPVPQAAQTFDTGFRKSSGDLWLSSIGVLTGSQGLPTGARASLLAARTLEE
jgi:hypothetical protein